MNLTGSVCIVTGLGDGRRRRMRRPARTQRCARRGQLHPQRAGRA
jgi:hypothetical protein